MKKIPILYLILFFTVVVIHIFANEAGQNMLMLGVMGYCAILLPSRIKRTDAWDLLPILIFVIMFCSQYIHPKEFRLSTVLYSAMFMIQCVVFRTYLNEDFKIDEYMKFIKMLIYLFTGVLVLQQALQLVHIQGFNRVPFDSTPWKMNSLSQEPSCLPPTMMLLMLSYAKMKQLVCEETMDIKELWRSDKKLWIAGLYTMVGCGTTSGIFIFPVFMAYFFQKQIIKSLPIVSVIGVIVFGVFANLFPYVVERFTNIFEVIGKMDPQLMYEADSSGSARIAPYMFLFNEFDLQDFNFWFGHGIDYAIHYFSLMLVGQEMGSEIGIGGLVNFLYDYGLIAFIAFIFYIKRICFHSLFSYEFIAWFLIYSINGFNSSLLWGSILFFGVNKYFESIYIGHYENINNNSDMECR